MFAALLELVLALKCAVQLLSACTVGHMRIFSFMLALEFLTW